MQRDTYKTVTVPIITYAFQQKRDGTASFLPDFKGLRPVRILRDKDLKQTGEIWQSITREQREEIIATANLISAIEKQDSLAAKKASIALAGSKSPELRKIVSEVADKIASYPQTQLDETISARLKSAQLVVWNYHGKPTLAIFCPSIVTALFAKLLLSRVSGKGLAVCPQCGIPFVTKRPNQDYCSIKHREAHRVARYRAKKTINSKNKKRRHDGSI
ncbi:MAG: hypothetical protein WA254_03875 [Candidatus Sulfotelmatobacter sp.]